MASQQWPPVRHLCRSAQCDVAAWMGGHLGGEWISACVWLSPFCCPLETITVLLIDYTAIQNKNIKNKTPGYREGGEEQAFSPEKTKSRGGKERSSRVWGELPAIFVLFFFSQILLIYKIQLIYNVMLIFVMQQIHSVTCIYLHFFHILIHYGLS